jgi:hypothetical protein
MDCQAMMQHDSGTFETWAFDLPPANIHYVVYAFHAIDPLEPVQKEALEVGRYQWRLLAQVIAWFHFRFRNFVSVAVMKVDGNGNVWIPLSWIRRK